jgi:hypothetical protein
MADVVERACGRRKRGRAHTMQRFLDARRIVAVEFAPELSCDGMIEPIGPIFDDGFKMRLKKNATGHRVRFTMAHEACHTFFYEFVPEIKFHPHGTDVLEERLCDFGAAAFLIPAASLRATSKGLPICLDSLDWLAQEYAVSSPTMLLRLNTLGLWKCELSLWHRTLTGDFVLDRLYGGRRAEWKWSDESVVERVWESNRSVYGTGFVYLDDGRAKRYRPVVYHARRSRSGALVLWGKGIRPVTPNYPLLDLAHAAGATAA